MKDSNRSSPQPHTSRLDSVTTTADPSFAGAHPLMRTFDRFASRVTRWAGSPITFCTSVFVVILWAVLGPTFHYSDGWQLVINTGTTIITFLMVFLIQQSQNKDSIAVHLKLNELLASHKSADNQLIGIEDASEDQLRTLAGFYNDLAERAQRGEAVQPETLPGHIADLLRQKNTRQIITGDKAR
ncbi:MAG: low affinity iron permease family protein [Janthinobacterium lividum]